MSDSIAAPGPGAETAAASAPRRDLLAVLRRPQTIRARCAAITAAVADERSGWFRIDRSQLPAAAARVAALTRSRFPDLRIPYHSRWRHFEAGGVDRKAELDALLAPLSPADRARAQFDLTVVSVLLDAGAGAQWQYREQQSAPLPAAALPGQRVSRDDLMAMLDQAAASPAPPQAEAASPAAGSAQPAQPAPGPSYGRSEGLGVASFRAFVAGAFSADANQPCRVDAAVLCQLDAAALRAMFQASPSNPLVGLEGRAGLLVRLGQALQAEAVRDGTPARPALLFDRLTEGGTRSEVTAADVLHHVLQALGPIWTSGSQVMGVTAGDVWPHRWAGAATGTADEHTVSRGWVPFHKLSQWLSYSLLEPLQWAGITVTGLDALTGLPEYRNGGLLIDAGVIVPRSATLFERRFKPADEAIVEWRALTVTLLDELADAVRAELGVSAEQLPLACVLEGGTWAAGRQIAAERRPGGGPPLVIDSDGTVF
ncbi:URC4/urg3 family protein [Pseudorhodoferax sp.]|uniref:URC4/urg3 family protein n=1 Tax=Pseudorhodoferax sp. TaxID=1993553 RepID=UPI002DD6420C|nr:URC4/urg3 family protein [Pseudorhodoferax sp.]